MAQADLKFKPFPPVDNAQAPRRMTEGAVGFDFWAEEIVYEDARSIWYRTGFGVNLTENVFGDLRARSSVSEMGLILANGAGVVDPDYQGEIQFRFYKIEQDSSKRRRNVDVYEPGDRIGQMVVVPTNSPYYTGTEVVDDFATMTERGEDGFGSTGT